MGIQGLAPELLKALGKTRRNQRGLDFCVKSSGGVVVSIQRWSMCYYLILLLCCFGQLTTEGYNFSYIRVATQSFINLRFRARGNDLTSPSLFSGTKKRVLEYCLIGAFSLIPLLPCGGAGADDDFFSSSSSSVAIRDVQQGLRNLLQETVTVPSALAQIEYLLNVFRLRSQLQYAVNSLPEEGRACASAEASQIVDKLFTITEYFSVDGASSGGVKMIISDAFPGQKSKFISQGLKAVDADFNDFFSCYR